MADDLDIFNIQYNNLKNAKGGRVSPQRDSIVRDNNITELSKISSLHDKPDFISGKKTFNAVVVMDYAKSTPPVAGSTLNSILSSFGDVNTDNLLQVRAIVPDAHDLVTPMPKDLSKESVRQSGEQQKFISLAPVFQSTGELNGSLTVGSIIEVEYNDDEYSEGKIVSIVKGAPYFEAKIQSAKDAFDNALQGISNLFGIGNQDGDEENVENLTTTYTGSCGGVGDYKTAECKSEALTATGQVVTLHPDFWDKVDELLVQISNEKDLKISVNSSIRTPEQQANLRKSKCPEWSLLLDTKTETEIMSMSWNDMNAAIKAKNTKGCSVQTAVGAAYGSSTSNHIKGLAIDLSMDVTCPNKTKDKTGWDNCRKTSKVFEYMNTFASSYGIVNFSEEPWHWSWNGS